MMAMFAALEAMPAVAEFRGSTYAYPLVNALHIIGIATLFGAILALDLRILGAGRRIKFEPLEAYLTRMALAGFALAALAGLLLFASAATDYAASPVFRVKMAAILLAGFNALVYRTLRARGFERPRIVAALSIALWLAAILLGRAIGYS